MLPAAGHPAGPAGEAAEQGLLRPQGTPPLADAAHTGQQPLPAGLPQTLPAPGLRQHHQWDPQSQL